ncbi:hypothetical protein FA10DRAFT_269184, partial [Acaromyces ingoldii]
MRWLLHPLRLLAAVPGCIGTFWLLRNAVLLLWHGDGFLGRADGRGDGHASLDRPCALDFFLACLWSITTAYHALSFTTLLLRRWLLYYSLVPSLIRLVALQAICWPLVRLTLYVAGPDEPTGAWVVVGTTTALSDTVARWVTSNLADVDAAEDAQLQHQQPQQQQQQQHGNGSKHRLVKKRGDRQRGSAFWRAVVGGPSSSSSRDAGTSEHRSNGSARIHSSNGNALHSQDELD